MVTGSHLVMLTYLEIPVLNFVETRGLNNTLKTEDLD